MSMGDIAVLGFVLFCLIGAGLAVAKASNK